MSERGDDLRHEVGLLRTEVDRLAADGTDTRRLAADTDEQVADLQAAFTAQTTVLNALRETQVEQHQTIQRLSAGVGGLTLQVTALDTKVTALAEGQAEHTRILAEILRRLPNPAGAAD